MHYKKKRSNPYKEANEAFLVEKSKEEGIVVLDSGVMYRKLEEGHGTLIFEMQLVKIER